MKLQLASTKPTWSAGQVIVGLTLSSTVTVASHVAVFPVASVIVRVIVLAPTFVQSNAV